MKINSNYKIREIAGETIVVNQDTYLKVQTLNWNAFID